MLPKRGVRIADEAVAIQVGDDRRSYVIRRDEIAERRGASHERVEQLAERVGLQLHFGDAGPFARNAEQLHSHVIGSKMLASTGFRFMATDQPVTGKSRAGKRATPKGRRVDPRAREEVRALLGQAPRRRDLLIEHLHRLQDRFGHLSAAHLTALAAEMKLAMAEVYEVATFYHHFDVVKEGEAPPPAITVRVCDSIACDIAGSRALLEALPALLGEHVRVLPAPCVGRCDTAPVAV